MRDTANTLADIDPRLLHEAFRRARESTAYDQVDSDALLSAIIAEARRGTRDVYGLVNAGRRAKSAA